MLRTEKVNSNSLPQENRAASTQSYTKRRQAPTTQTTTPTNQGYFYSCLKSPVEYFQKQYNSMAFRKRILKETKELQLQSLPGITTTFTDNLHLLYVDITIQNNPLYLDKKYRLKIIIPENYPFVAPVTVFVKDFKADVLEIPVHPHIYSNGHICLDLLGPAWTPIHTVSSLVLSLQSILASNSHNERPPDDSRYVRHAPKDPTKSSFIYHDETV